MACEDSGVPDDDEPKIIPGPTFSDATSSDRYIIDQIRQAGGDLSKPRHTRFFLFFPTEAQAYDATAELRSAGELSALDLTFVGTATDGLGLVRLEGEIVVNEQAITLISERLEAVADANSGEYDGWEASQRP